MSSSHRDLPDAFACALRAWNLFPPKTQYFSGLGDWPILPRFFILAQNLRPPLCHSAFTMPKSTKKRQLSADEGDHSEPEARQKKAKTDKKSNPAPKSSPSEEPSWQASFP